MHKILDWNGVCGALLTDLSKGFDCLPHSFLIAKRHEFDKNYTEYLKDSGKKDKKLISRLATGQIYFMDYHKASY